MARGVGLKTYEDVVNPVEPRPSGVGQGMVRTFSTDLPQMSYGTQIQAGRQLQEIGEEIFASASQQLTQKQAQSAEIAIDPQTGEYIRPQTPVMGLANQALYNKIVDQTFTERVYRDFEGRANEIAGKYFDQPEEAGKLMSELATATLGKVREPHLQNALGMIMQREVNERQKAIVGMRARMDYQNIQEHSKLEENDRTEKALAAYRIGDMARGDEEASLALAQTARRVQLGMDDAGVLDLKKDSLNSLRHTGTLMNMIERLDTNGTLKPDDFDILQTMLRGGGSNETNWNGVTKAELFDKIPHQRDRDQLAVRLQQIEAQYYKKAALKAQTVEPADYENGFRASGRTGKPVSWSDAEDGARSQAYAAWKGFSPLSGEGVDHFWRMRGDLPKGLYEKEFKGAYAQGPERLKQLAATWNAMEKLKSPSGLEVGAPKGVVADEDAAFMTTFSRIYGQTGDAVRAQEQAVALMKQGEGRLKDAQSHVDFVVKRRQAETGTDHKAADITRDITGKVKGIDGAQLQTVVTSIAGLMAKDMTYEQARDQAVARFGQTHRQSNYILGPGAKAGGWVPAATALPLAADPRGTGGRSEEWARPYVNGLGKLNIDGTVETHKVKTGKTLTDLTGALKDVEVEEPKDPFIPRVQAGRRIEAIDLGKNTFLVPTGTSTDNPQFTLMYKDDIGPIELRDKRGQLITLRFGAAARHQDEMARYERLTKPRAERTAEDLPDVNDPYAVVAGRVNPLTILDRAPPADRTAPNFTPDTSRGGRSSRFEIRHRNDGLPSPFQDGDFSAFNLAGLRAHEGVKFSVTNTSGPRAGKTITISQELSRGLDAMIAAMPDEIREGFRIGSTVRSYEEQAEISRDDVLKHGRPRMAARPGHSQHEHGHAADLKMSPKVEAWVHRHAGRFGLHFPLDGKEGRPYEPWHVEPIGVRRVRLPGQTSAIEADSEHWEG